MSGDNDVGGEGFDRYNGKKESNFNKMFYQDADPHWVTTVGEVNFVKVFISYVSDIH